MNLSCEPCRAIAFDRARLSLTKKLTENKEQLAELEVTNRERLVCAETTKAPGTWSDPQVVGQQAMSNTTGLDTTWGSEALEAARSLVWLARFYLYPI